MSKTLWLIDGSSYIYRAFYALPPLTNSNNMPTGALYGLAKMLKSLQVEHKPEYICIALDPPGKTTRNNWFTDYKANRSAMPEALKVQMPYVETMLKALGYKTIKMAGEEADDVIGTLSKQAEQAGFKVIISSPDKDFAQLVSDNITLENTMTGKILDIAGVLEKFGIKPTQIIDYLALIGDSADNIPGIPKVGPKTASKWLTKYESISTIANNLDAITGAVGNSLRDNFDKLPLYQKLVTINTKLPIEFIPKDCQLNPADHKQLTDIYQELGFSTWLKELPTTKPSSFTSIKVDSLAQLSDAIRTAELISLAKQDSVTYIATEQNNFSSTINFTDILTLTNNTPVIIGYDLKSWFMVSDISVDRLFDLKLAQYIINSHKQTNNLLELGEIYAITSDNPARVALDLYYLFKQKFSHQLRQEKLFHNLEMPLIKILWQMEQTGILLDSETLNQLSQTLTKKLATINATAQNLAQKDFNLASPKQIRQILFDDLALPVNFKTSKGEPSTSEDALNSLIDQHPLPEIILQHRQISKLLTTYAKPLPKMVAKTGRIHGSFNQAITVTGRLSSQNPNLQNIPIRSEQNIRAAFIAGKDNILISADYSQIELRIMAHLSQDPSLIAAFTNNQDVHSHTAAKLFKTPVNAVNAEQRRKAKVINFGLIYGMSAFGLSKQLKCSNKHAKELITDYFDKYPGVLQYMETTKTFVRKHGFIESLSGRRIYFSEMSAASERAAINGPMQATAADMIKQAMLNIAPRLAKFQAKMILQVHDELIFECPIQNKLPLAKIIEQEMLAVANLSVPLAINLASGTSWGHLKRFTPSSDTKM